MLCPHCSHEVPESEVRSVQCPKCLHWFHINPPDDTKQRETCQKCGNMLYSGVRVKCLP